MTRISGTILAALILTSGAASDRKDSVDGLLQYFRMLPAQVHAAPRLKSVRSDTDHDCHCQVGSENECMTPKDCYAAGGSCGGDC
jgi:hypothetical protein